MKIQTVKIVASDANSQGPFVRINADDYNPEIHQLWNPSEKPDAAPKAAKKVGKKATRKSKG